MSIIRDYPFDETANSPIAHDYSINEDHGKVYNASFVPGKHGYAINFNGEGYVKTQYTFIDLQGDFSFVFWLKAKKVPKYSAPGFVNFKFLMDDINNTIEQFGSPSVLDKWEFWGFSKQGTTVTMYKNCNPISVKYLTAGNLVAWSVEQTSPGKPVSLTTPVSFVFGNNSAPYGLGLVDGVKIFDRALTAAEMCDAGNLSVNRKAFYRIDDTPFTDLDVYVSASKGLVDALKMKSAFNADWADEHGRVTDLHRPRFEPREIELECFMKAEGMLGWTQKMDEFLRKFTSPGSHRLKVEIDERKPLVYEVYAPEGTSIRKRWYDADMLGTFTLRLVEPEPVKKVLRFVSKPALLNQFPVVYSDVYIVIKSTSPVNIYWGDGTSNKDIVADDYVTLWHTYPVQGKPYEIIIAGEVDNIVEMATNAFTIWSRL